jgi:mannose-1-phosphate guanylyltransferase
MVAVDDPVPSASQHAVVMAGGSGTRFWPRSRSRVPKQLLPIAGPRTMLQDTVRRIRPLVPATRVLVVTNAAQARAVRRQVPAIPARNVLVEPRGRNTAAAIALAALRLRRVAPQGVMIVLSSDHVVADEPAFRRCVETAIAVAVESETLVTLGVVPTRPETGYGYIRPGAVLSGSRRRAWRVARFVEKPPVAKARRLLADGALWNTGMFVWRVDVVLDALRAHVPRVLGPLERAVDRGGAAALAAAYARVPAVSIDTGVLERARNVAVVPARFPWSDVGTWAAVEDLWRRPGAANAVRGRAIAIDSEGCVVDAGERLVALVGVRDLVVVETADAVLVCRKDRAQDVRRVVAEIETRGWRRYQ